MDQIRKCLDKKNCTALSFCERFSTLHDYSHVIGMGNLLIEKGKLTQKTNNNQDQYRNLLNGMYSKNVQIDVTTKEEHCMEIFEKILSIYTDKPPMILLCQDYNNDGCIDTEFHQLVDEPCKEEVWKCQAGGGCAEVFAMCRNQQNIPIFVAIMAPNVKLETLNEKKITTAISKFSFSDLPKGNVRRQQSILKKNIV